MSETRDNLPDRAGARFVTGASYTGIVVFIVVMLYSNKWKEGILDASVAALICGLVAGLLAAFGKRILRAILAFLDELIASP